MENDVFPPLRYPSAMLSEWLRTQMEFRGMSQAEMARRLTESLGRSIDRAAVNKMLSGRRKISADEMVAITQILDVPAPVGVSEGEGLRMVTVAAHVQAGAFAETWEWEEAVQYQVAVPDDPSLRGLRLYAAETRGPSMNRRYPEGTVVVFTNIAETQEQPLAGKRYIVERKRAGGEAEHTVKLLWQDDAGDFWLMPESDDPRHQSPISVDESSGDDDEVTIIGRVRFAVLRE